MTIDTLGLKACILGTYVPSCLAKTPVVSFEFQPSELDTADVTRSSQLVPPQRFTPRPRSA